MPPNESPKDVEYNQPKKLPYLCESKSSGIVVRDESNNESYNIVQINETNDSTDRKNPVIYRPWLMPAEIYFLRMYRMLPRSLRSYWLDKGWGRTLVNSATYIGGAVKIMLRNPSLLKTYVQDPATLNTRYSRVKYGEHLSQVMDVFPCSNSPKAGKGRNGGQSSTAGCDPAPPVLVFVHGGGWGSGNPYMYRAIGTKFSELGFHCIIVGYRTYPCATIEGQIEDVACALQFIRHGINEGATEFGEISRDSDIHLSGHSSGAHVAALALINQRESLDFIHGFIGFAGPYDLHDQLKFHLEIGIGGVGPMEAANRGATSFDKYSPVKLMAKDTRPVILMAKDTRRKSTKGISENEFTGKTKDVINAGKRLRLLPKSFFIHGSSDAIIPCESSLKMHAIAKSNGVPSKLEIVRGGDHFSLLTELMDMTPQSEMFLRLRTHLLR